jgi:predicted ATP-grasp superfamily ATP-dependent carboligase
MLHTDWHWSPKLYVLKDNPKQQELVRIAASMRDRVNIEIIELSLEEAKKTPYKLLPRLEGNLTLEMAGVELQDTLKLIANLEQVEGLIPSLKMLFPR